VDAVIGGEADSVGMGREQAGGVEDEVLGRDVGDFDGAVEMEGAGGVDGLKEGGDAVGSDPAGGEELGLDAGEAEEEAGGDAVGGAGKGEGAEDLDKDGGGGEVGGQGRGEVVGGGDGCQSDRFERERG